MTCNVGASFTWDFVSVSVTGNSTANTANWDPANPRFFSGTNCNATGSTDFSQSLISYTLLLINGNQVKQYPDPTNPSATSSLSVVFDSTHFGDTNPITVEYQIQDTAGDPVVVKDVTANAYNEGYLLNDTAFTSGNGLTALTDVGTRLGGMNHDTVSSEASKDSINSALPTYTVFYAYTHGYVDSFNHTAFGDGSAQSVDYYIGLGQNWTDHYVLSSEVLASPNTKSLSQPPYNLAFVDGCETGVQSDLAYAFLYGNPSGGSGATDRAYLGWEVDLADDMRNVNWTNRMFQNLENGEILSDAIKDASSVEAPIGVDENGLGFDVDTSSQLATFGDGGMKLHEVYPNTGTNWWK
jgi:hypothetical protein